MWEAFKKILQSYTILFQYINERTFSVFYTVLVLVLILFVLVNILLYF